MPAGAVSRSLVLLEERKLISVEQTRTRGRAAIVRLTAEGRKLSEKLLKVSREREARLFKNFSRPDWDKGCRLPSLEAIRTFLDRRAIIPLGSCFGCIFE